MFSQNPINVALIKTKNRIIKSKIPAPGTKKILSSLKKNEVRSMHGQLPIIWKKAEGFNVYDISNNKYIDFTSTIFVSNIGHSNNYLKNQIIRTLKSNLISTYAYAHKNREKYIRELVKFCGTNFEKAFLLSSGSEATEACLKIMRMHGIKNKKKPGILTISGNWHGRTMGSQFLSDNSSQSEWIGHKDKNIFHLRFPYPWLIKNKKDCNKILDEDLEKLSKRVNFKKDISGIMLETFQGWGALFYPIEYINKLEKFCKKNKILIAFDEIQAGFARTGKKFGFEHYKIKPDLICCGKGIGGGIALSAVIGKKNIMDLPTIGSMSSTHSANPIACSAGLAVLKEIKNKDLVRKSFLKGQLLEKKLFEIKNSFPDLVRHISSKGLIGAIIFKNFAGKNTNRIIGNICEKCMQKGLLVVYTGRESIKLGPPLVISREAIFEAMNIIKESIKETIKDN